MRAITNSSRKNEAAGPKQKQHSGTMGLRAKVKSDAVRTILHRNLDWIRSMNQGKLDVAKWEMARVNINILGISEMGKFNSEDHYIYYSGKNPLEEME